jgi:hypothetical protein
MRYSKEAKITLSVDDLTSPKQIRFQEVQSTVDTTLISEAKINDEVIPKASVDYELPFGKVATAKWLYMVGDNPFSYKLNNSVALTAVPGMPIEMWTEITSIKITTPGVADSPDVTINWAIGGA